MKKGLFGALLLVFLSFSLSLAADCPSLETVQKGLRHTFPRAKSLQIKEIRPASAPGYCEVVVSTGAKRQNIVYVSHNGRFLFLGQLFDLQTGRNLTRARLSELNRLSPAELKKLEEVVAFTAGQGPKTLYLVTDPDCPFCKRMEKVLDSLLKEGQITVKVILYPLERLHPQAKKKCIAIICDHKGWSGLLEGYVSENQCPEGEKKVSAAQKLLPQLGVRGTPAIILPDGRLLPGAKSRQQLEMILGLKGTEKVSK